MENKDIVPEKKKYNTFVMLFFCLFVSVFISCLPGMFISPINVTQFYDYRYFFILSYVIYGVRVYSQKNIYKDFILLLSRKDSFYTKILYIMTNMIFCIFVSMTLFNICGNVNVYVGKTSKVDVEAILTNKYIDNEADGTKDEDGNYNGRFVMEYKIIKNGKEMDWMAREQIYNEGRIGNKYKLNLYVGSLGLYFYYSKKPWKITLLDNTMVYMID